MSLLHGGADEELLLERPLAAEPRSSLRKQLALLGGLALCSAVVGAATAGLIVHSSSPQSPAAGAPQHLPTPAADTPAADPCRYAPLAWPCAPSLEASLDPIQPFSFRKVLVATAHPDDESMAGGFLAHLARGGAEIRFVVATNGDKGTNDLSITSPQLRVMRAAEMRNAAAALGGTAVLLDYEDGELDISHSKEAGGLQGRDTRYELRLRLSAQIRMFEPDLLITFNPVPNFGEYQRGSQHKDHQWIGGEALACFYPIARDHLQVRNPTSRPWL